MFVFVLPNRFCVMQRVIAQSNCARVRSLLQSHTPFIRLVMSSAAKHTNALSEQHSPYLLQHAHNPVQWYPWGEQAFKLAREQNKLIFLSVGYSTCHWCHVMEHESFECEQTAAIMNEHYINIKVDREERPDVDKVYMTFVQAMSGGAGGWPMSVFLTPALNPVTGGTYFPPEDSMGRPGFKSVLNMIAEHWRDKRADIERQSEGIRGQLTRAFANTGRVADGTVLPDCSLVADNAFKYYNQEFDARWGGFGDAPKFPQPSNLSLLLSVYLCDKETERGEQAMLMLETTLLRMAMGGIYDHIADGFHRYSVDERWHVPHFEKMLYDQAQLAVLLADLYEHRPLPQHERLLKGILTYVQRDLSHQLGGFFSAEDADSLPSYDATQKKEGAFCVWSWAEIQQLLGALKVDGTERTVAEVFVHYYNVKHNGNTNPQMDPHGELKGQNVLIIYEGVDKTADELELSETQVLGALRCARDVLYAHRQTRPAPHLDTKMLTSCNGYYCKSPYTAFLKLKASRVSCYYTSLFAGLMLSAFARAAKVLKCDEYKHRACTAAIFLRGHAVHQDTDRLLRACYAKSRDDASVTNIESPIFGFADDYAFLISGLLDVYELTEDKDWLDWARQLHTQMDGLFWDSANDAGYFLNTADDPSIMLRLKDEQDGAEPAVNSVAVDNLLRLATVAESNQCKGQYEHKAHRILLAFQQRITKHPFVLPKMASSLLNHKHKKSTQV